MWVRLVAHASGYFGQSLFDQTVRTPMLGQQRDAALVGFVVDPIEIGMQIDRGGLAGVPFDSVDPLDCFPRWITIEELEPVPSPTSAPLGNVRVPDNESSDPTTSWIGSMADLENDRFGVSKPANRPGIGPAPPGNSQKRFLK